MDGLTIRMEDDLRAALHVAAEAGGVSDGEMARRIIRRGLAIAASDAQAQVLAAAVRGVIHDELRLTRHYAWLAAREAAASHRYGKGVVGILVNHLVRLPSDERQAVLDQSEAAAQRFATQRLQNDKEPDDLALDAPAKPLPGPEDEVTVEDENTASMIEGS